MSKQDEREREIRERQARGFGFIYESDIKLLLSLLDATRKERDEARIALAKMPNDLEALSLREAIRSEVITEGLQWMQDGPIYKERVAELEGALRKLLDNSILLSDTYLMYFEDKPDDYCLQGWDKRQWVQLSKVAKEAEALLSKEQI